MDQEERRARREEARRRVRRQRRVVAGLLVCVPLLGAGGGLALTGGDEDDDRAARAQPPPPPELPRGGRTLFPRHRIVGFYGAPQDRELGALGIGTPTRAARRLRRQSRPYARGRRPVLPMLELIAVIAQGARGHDGKYRARQRRSTIRRYLAAARRERALLVLDVQPGHAEFMDEVRRLEPFLKEPDVGLALDPEWYTPGAVPGRVIGSTDAATVNRIGAYLSRLVRRGRLPEKLLLVHQFTAGMIRDRDRLARHPGVALAINVDGFGDRPNKRAKYREFTRARPRFRNGFKLFYREDTDLMRPRDVLRLRPRPDIVVYE